MKASPAAEAARRAPRAGGRRRRPARAAAALPAPLPGEARRSRWPTPHLLVKYAVRYKGEDETIGVRAWPLAGATAGRRARGGAARGRRGGGRRRGARRGCATSSCRPGSRRRGGEGRREGAQRAPDRQARGHGLPRPRDEGASRARARRARRSRRGSRPAAAGTRRRSCARSSRRSRRDLAVREQEVAGRKQEKWLAVGSAVLKNIGLLTGRKRSVSGVGSVLTKNRMEDTAEARLEALRAEVAELEEQLAEAPEVDPARSSRRPSRRCAAAWSCCATSSSGCTDHVRPALPAAPAGRDAVRPDRPGDARGAGTARAGCPRTRSCGPRARPSG